jgi:hypothetical protein
MSLGLSVATDIVLTADCCRFAIIDFQQKLQQVAMEEAPPTQPEFRILFDDYGCGPNSDRVLEGEVTSDVEKFPLVIRMVSVLKTNSERKAMPPNQRMDIGQ